MATVKEKVIIKLREADSLEKSIEVARIDKEKTYQRALEAEVEVEADTNLLQTQELSLKVYEEPTIITMSYFSS